MGSTDKISDIVFTNNGTLYISLNNYEDKFYVFKSVDLGINWTISGQWINYGPGKSRNPCLAYDSLNNLLYISMSAVNGSEYSPGDRYANFTFSVLNLSTNLWGQPQSTPIIKVGSFAFSFSEPYLLITRNTTSSPLIVKAIFQYDLDISQ